MSLVKELKVSFSGFNRRNSYVLMLLTLAYTCSELAHYLIGSLALPMSREIGFGDYGCSLKEGVKSSSVICRDFKTKNS